MARLSQHDIIKALLIRVCETKNVNIHLGKNYFVNIYSKIPTYYENFVKTAESIYDIHGHDTSTVVEDIRKYFRMDLVQ